MKKGVSGLMLTLVIALIITVVTIAMVFITSTEFAPKLLAGMQDVICALPFLC